jgi:hypothetical protein
VRNQVLHPYKTAGKIIGYIMMVVVVVVVIIITIIIINANVTPKFSMCPLILLLFPPVKCLVRYEKL